MTTEEKIQKLAEIALEIKAFKGLDIAKNCTHAVPGEGDPDAQIMFIGEGPGYNEDLQGRPFVGQAGKLLEKTLKDVLNLERSDVFITNVVKFRPPDNRDPLPNEIEACRDWLDRQISIIQPKIIATLGRYSMAKFIPDVSISRVHGQARFVNFSTDNCQLKIIVFPMYHPAAALRAGIVMNEFVQDFKKLKSLLGASHPDIPQIEPEPPKITQQSLF
jgi:uracil-DNA glycosylase family 4